MSEIPVVTMVVKESHPRTQRMSRGLEYPWIVYYVDRGGWCLTTTGSKTEADARVQAKTLMEGGHKSVLVAHIDLPPMPY